ncbi:MAG: putative PEP-binding protein [Spirulinaceae cyanobacterium]
MTTIYHFDQIQPSECFLVGEKAFALSQLYQHGFPVIPGFVVSVTCLEEFLTIISQTEPLLLDWPVSSLHINIDNPKTLQEVAQRIRHQIVNTSFPDSWGTNFSSAVEEFPSSYAILRPSVTLPPNFNVDFAGILKSQICRCDSYSWEIALKKAWAELFRARSLFYWQRLGINLHQVGLAILVQPIQNAIASGTVEVSPQSLQIKANYGLGHSLVEGSVIPDYYEVQRFTNQVIKQNLGNKALAYKLGEDCLETYLLSPEEQESYSLNQTFLNIITKLVQKRFPHKSTLATLEWTIIASAQSQVYLTQINTHKFIYQARYTQKEAALKPKNSSSMLLQGIPAAPGQTVAKAHLISGKPQHFQSVPSQRILVAKKFTPDWLPILQQAAGMVTEEGGKTSHEAIIARELNIPAVVGVKDATKKINNGLTLLIDGDKGEVHNCPEYDSETTPQKPPPSKPKEISYHPIATKLLVNLSQTSSIPEVVDLPVDGLGLLRSELMIMELLNSHPLSWWLHPSRKTLLLEQLIQLITQFAQAFAPRPIFYRSLDRRALKIARISEIAAASEVNPPSLLGERGAYNYRLDGSLFDLELQALVKLYNSGYRNIKLILPFIRSVPEFTFCRDRIIAAGLNNYPGFQLWIMAEVPSVIFLLPEYVKAGVQGIAIGSNDLTQLILGIDREDASLEQLCSEAYPAVIKAIEQLVKQAVKLNIPSSICGQLAIQYPEIIEQLIRWGITSISVDYHGVETTYQAIARGEKSLLLESARKQFNQ